jgi:hypothetical protein
VLFANVATLIRYHHVPWQGRTDGEPPPMGSQMILLADEVDRTFRRDVFVLEQRDAISGHVRSRSGTQLAPACVEAFRELAATEAFWLDFTSDRIYGILLEQVDWPALTLDELVIEPIAEIFARLIDASSRWTATHSAGVTATAVALSARLRLSQREQALMRVAGHLHDLGKLVIPPGILDKPGKLTDAEMARMKQHAYHTYRILHTIGGMPQIAEWAGYHHERLDGQGYPFHYRGPDLTLGSRIMAVADIFTAVAEHRPYRAGMSKDQAFSILDRLVDNGGIDGDVVGVLRRNFDEINAVRQAEQAESEARQARLAEPADRAGAAEVAGASRGPGRTAATSEAGTEFPSQVARDGCGLESVEDVYARASVAGDARAELSPSITAVTACSPGQAPGAPMAPFFACLGQPSGLLP